MLHLGPLTDPYFEAHFSYALPGGSFQRCETLDEATCVWFVCPCGEHHVRIPFKNPRQRAPEGGGHGWGMAGTGLHDLTLTPSIAVSSKPSGECWHGFVTNGQVT